MSDAVVLSTFRGHQTRRRYESDEWIYRDTGQPVAETWRGRPCGHCGLHFTDDGHDGCLGELPGVKNACCGHGDIGKAYVQFRGGARLAGETARLFFQSVKEATDE